MNTGRRVLLEPAFLLHHRPFRDSSRILELLTRTHGRVTLFARGSRRPTSALRAALQPFQPLLVSWSGRADGGQLTGAELAGLAAALPPARLMSAFYLNELLMKLLPREDTHPEVFDAYAGALESLRIGPAEQPALRLFEKQLLESLGYGLELEREARSGEPVEPASYYHFRPDRGPLQVREAEPPPHAFRGSELLALARGRLEDPADLRAARRLLRDALDACLDGGTLRSREVMLAMRRRETDK